TPRVGCTYVITPNPGDQYCISKGWSNPCDSIKTGCGTTGAVSKGVTFGAFENNNAYSLIKIDIPENLPPCLQRFTISVKCEDRTIAGTQYKFSTTEFVQQSFDIEVMKKGIF
ncbi:MAG: hypothetical protein NTZ83_06660, partial [Candidatus Pacearchaeota archaeon]|nr:hypothetical protein [Candidatus Pacearchaeota archaeon]